jgi:hypothetical protein
MLAPGRSAASTRAMVLLNHYCTSQPKYRLSNSPQSSQQHLANNVKIRSNLRYDFYVKNICGKNHERQLVIFSYNSRNTMSHMFFRASYKINIHIEYTKLIVVKYENKFANGMTQTIGPSRPNTKHTL